MSCSPTFHHNDIFINKGIIMAIITYERFITYKKIKDLVHLINDKQKTQIEKLSDVYDTQSIKNRLDSIRQFILCGVDEHWLGRLRLIQRKLKTDAISVYACKVRYGDKWNVKRNELIEQVKGSEENYVRRFGEEEGKRRWEEFKNLKTYGLEYMVERYGEEEGKKRWEKALSQKVNTMAERKKIQPYRNGRTLFELQNKHGIKEGYDRWVEMCEKVGYCQTLEFYIERYGEEDGTKRYEQRCLLRDTNSLKSHIRRYGEEEGTKRYEEFVKKVKIRSSKEYIILTKGEDYYKELVKKKLNYFDKSYSKVSQELFWLIYEKLEKTEKCYFAELNEEFSFYIWENNMTIINVDFKLGNNIIEFDGEYWHSRPEQIKKDKERDEYLIKKGYNLLRVKERDYYKDKEKVVEQCIKFLNDGK